jgi:hypothetical protein
MALGYAWLDSGNDGIKKIAHAYVVRYLALQCSVPF